MLVIAEHMFAKWDYTLAALIVLCLAAFFYMDFFVFLSCFLPHISFVYFFPFSKTFQLFFALDLCFLEPQKFKVKH